MALSMSSFLPMHTPAYSRRVAAFLSLLLFLSSGSARAQLQALSSPQTRAAASDTVSQFLVWEGEERIGGLAVYAPPGWRLLEARVAGTTGRYDHILEAKAADQPGKWILSYPSDGLSRGTAIRLLMRTSASERSSLRAVPLMPVRQGFEEGTGFGVETVWDVLETRAMGQHRALALHGNANTAPRVRADFPVPEGDDAWTMTWWLRSSALDQVVASTWTGDEADPYPMEAILDERGHLTVYTGREGRHYAMRSKQPIADGTWHHVALVHHAAQQKMRMHVDGQVQDSLLFSADASRAGDFSEVRLGYRLTSARPDLSASLTGELDGIHLFAQALAGPALDGLNAGRVDALAGRIWSLDFDDPDSRILEEAGILPDRLVPNMLSFRKTASALQVSRTQDGILLSFDSGDEEISSYRIDVSDDGELFRQAATLESAVRVGSRMEWLDRTPPSAVRHYRVTAMYPDGEGASSPTLKVGLGTDAPSANVLLEGNFPNPFNPTTTIRYEVLAQERIRVSIWDLSGQMIAQPVDAEHQPGRYEVRFDAGTLPSGTYFVRLESASGIQTHQMILMK